MSARDPRRARRARLLGTVVVGALGVLGCRGAEVSPPPREAATPVEPRTSEPEAPRPAPISDDPVIRAIVALAAEDSEVDDHLEALAVGIGPRLTGTPQLTEAELWAVDQFESWGLVAAREPWGELPVAFERGKASGAVVRPERRSLEIGTWAWTPGTHGQDGLEAGGPLRGQALLYPSSASGLRELEPHLRGAWILIPHGFERPRGTPRKQLERAFERAPIAGYVWAAGGPEDTRIQTHGKHRLDPDELPERVDVRLRGDQFQELHELLDAGEYVELEFAVGNRLLPGPVPVHNVIAELPGAELPQQRVIVGAHLDSWDGASGAIDNATGVATTMEAARLIAAACVATGRRPRRSLSFQLWSGEEQGLLGSKAWVEAHASELAEVSAVLVHDEGTNYISGLPVTPELHASLSAVFEPVTKLAPEAMPFALELVEGLPLEPSDSTSFLRAGVPAFFWKQAGRSDYDRYHHTQYDRADAVIDEYQRHSAQVVAIAAWQLAQLDAPLDRSNLEGAPPRRLGVSLDMVTILGIDRGTVASAAGLREGDRVVAIDGVAVSDTDELAAALQRGGPQKSARVERASDGAVEVLDVELDWREDPDEAAREALRERRRAAFGPELRPWDAPEPGIGTRGPAGTGEGTR